MILAHTLGDGGPEIEFLVLAAGMLVLGVIFFFQKTVKPQVPLVLVLGAFALTAGAFAFGGDADEMEGSGLSTDARVRIVSPVEGEIVPADEPLTLEVEIVGGSLTEATTSDDPTEGHLHIYVDGDLISMPSVYDPEVGAEWLPPGEHEIAVEFTTADHRPFTPPEIERVNVVAE